MGDINNFTNTWKSWSEVVNRSIKNIDRQYRILIWVCNEYSHRLLNLTKFVTFLFFNY